MTTGVERAKTKLQNKMALLMVSIQIITAIAVLFTVVYIYQFTMLSSGGAALQKSLQMVVFNIDAAQIMQYDKTGKRDSEYQALYQYLSDIKTLDKISMIAILTDRGETYKYIIEGGIGRDRRTMQEGLGDIEDKALYRPEIQKVFDGGAATHTEVYHSAFDRDVISAVAPIKDARGRVVAVLYADMLKETIINDGLANLYEILPYVAGVLGVACLLVALFSVFYIHRRVIVPIRIVGELSQELAQGRMGNKVPEDILHRTDEIGVLSRSYVGMAANIRTLTEEIDSLIEFALKEDFEKRADCEKLEGGYKKIMENLNELLKLVVNKTIFYETLLDAVSSPVAAIDKEKKVSYINKAGAEMMQKKQAEMIGVACSALGTAYCDTEECVICRMEKEGTDFVKAPNFEVNGRVFKLRAAKVYNKDGEVFCYLETAMDITSEVRLDAYQRAEIQNISEGLARLADGDLSIVLEETNLDGEKDDAYLQGVRKNFSVIRDNINKAVSSFRTYITDISDTLTAMAYGNIDQEVRLEYRGDFAQVKDSLNIIIVKFNEIINEINSSAEQVRIASGSVLAGSQSLAQATSEQMAASQEISATMEMVAGKAKENASNARKANHFVESTKNTSKEGAEKMREMIQAITEINQASGDISRIIRTIDDIAFQTNILALNAAVEAARAGQYGKGFGVVASEVRNLAAKSAKAAKDTTDMIEGTVKKTAKGVTIAGKASEAFEQILASITEAVGVVNGISEATNEQAISISQISQGVENISSVAANNSHTAHESASASQQMYTQADALKGIIRMFTLKNAKEVRDDARSGGEKERVTQETEQTPDMHADMLPDIQDNGGYSEDKFRFKASDFKKF